MEPGVHPKYQMNVRSFRFKYYIHDSIDALRFELIGELTEGDLPDLEGCWKTAQTTLDGRKLVIDTLQLESMDPAGRAWIDSMLAAGAQSLERDAVQRAPAKASLLRRVLSASPKLSQSSTQAQ